MPFVEKPHPHFQINAGKAAMIVSQRHPYYKGATKAMAKQAKELAISTLQAQVRAWALDNLLGKPFAKQGLQVEFATESILRILAQPHHAKYHQLLALYDFGTLLEQATFYRSTTKELYYKVNIHDIPSLIHVQKNKRIVYNIIEKNN